MSWPLGKPAVVFVVNLGNDILFHITKKDNGKNNFLLPSTIWISPAKMKIWKDNLGQGHLSATDAEND